MYEVKIYAIGVSIISNMLRISSNVLKYVKITTRPPHVGSRKTKINIAM